VKVSILHFVSCLSNIATLHARTLFSSSPQCSFLIAAIVYVCTIQPRLPRPWIYYIISQFTIIIMKENQGTIRPTTGYERLVQQEDEEKAASTSPSISRYHYPNFYIYGLIFIIIFASVLLISSINTVLQKPATYPRCSFSLCFLPSSLFPLPSYSSTALPSSFLCYIQ